MAPLVAEECANQFHIIDMIRITDTLRNRYPDMKQSYSGEGLALILEQSAANLQELPNAANAFLEVRSGEMISVTIESATVMRGVLSLFIRDYSGPPMDRGARVFW